MHAIYTHKKLIELLTEKAQQMYLIKIKGKI